MALRTGGAPLGTVLNLRVADPRGFRGSGFGSCLCLRIEQLSFQRVPVQVLLSAAIIVIGLYNDLRDWVWED